MNKVIFIFYVHRMVMQDIIMSNLDGATVITMEESTNLLKNSHISKKLTKP